MSPVLFFGISQYRANKDAAIRLDELKEEAEKYWQEAINQNATPSKITHLSYRLQDNHSWGEGASDDYWHFLGQSE